MSQPTRLPDDELDPLLLSDPDVQELVEEHLTELRQDAYGPRILASFILAGAFVVGLAAYVAGYLLKSTATTEPLGLLADMLYKIGFALWTGAVVVVLVEIIRKRSVGRIKCALEAYEAIRREKAPRKDTT